MGTIYRFRTTTKPDKARNVPESYQWNISEGYGYNLPVPHRAQTVWNTLYDWSIDLQALSK